MTRKEGHIIILHKYGMSRINKALSYMLSALKTVTSNSLAVSSFRHHHYIGKRIIKWQDYKDNEGRDGNNEDKKEAKHERNG